MTKVPGMRNLRMMDGWVGFKSIWVRLFMEELKWYALDLMGMGRRQGLIGVGWGGGGV